MSGRSHTVTSLSELTFSATAVKFEGGDRIDASIFVTTYERGQGVGLHVHPYPEAFLIESGVAEFTIGEETVTVGAGHIVTVPAETPHGFAGVSEEALRVVSVHPSPTVEQTFL